MSAQYYNYLQNISEGGSSLHSDIDHYSTTKKLSDTTCNIEWELNSLH
jgi:hypothetical protein